MKLWGKCCVDVAFVGICPCSSWGSPEDIHPHVDWLPIQASPAHPMHSGCVAILGIPRAFL